MLAGSDPLTLIVKSYAYSEKNYGTDEDPDLELEAATKQAPPRERIVPSGVLA